jgi:tetrahydromethanopterin S-methyltransferase subunit A
MSSYRIESPGNYEENWPPLRGEYSVGDPNNSIAVVTLASQLHIMGAAIVGPCKTENLGVEKVVANVISNSNIRFLMICGAESKGHLPGDAIMSLHRNGMDEKGRIIGSRGAIPFIQNLPPEAINRFRKQVQVLDLIGLEDERKINLLIKDYSSRAEPYPEEPFQVMKRPIKRGSPRIEGGDLYLGSGVIMNTSAWLVLSRR